LIYIYGMGPAAFRSVLPVQYWKHFCKLVRAIHIHQKYKITHNELVEASELVVEFVEEFEILYVAGRADRLHFVRPWLHTLLHIAHEVMRVGPTAYYTQWTLERIIGLLKAGLHQHVTPYANLAYVAARQAQANAIRSHLPDYEPIMRPLPVGALDLGDGYSLRRAHEDCMRPILECETEAIQQYYVRKGNNQQTPVNKVRCWAWAGLPNGAVARSNWKETQRPIEKVRRARMIEVHTFST
jgi:hypothetical protein